MAMEDQDILDQIAELRRQRAQELQAMQSESNPIGLALSGALGGLADYTAAGAGLTGGYTDKAVGAYNTAQKSGRDMRLKALEGSGEEIKALNALAQSRTTDRRAEANRQADMKRVEMQLAGHASEGEKNRANALALVNAKEENKVPKGMMYALDPVSGEKALVPVAGKPLVASQSEAMSGSKAAYSQLDDLRTAIDAHKDTMGPFMGRVGALNPYDTTAQSLDALAKKAAQTIGKSLEGGKLAEGDIKRYRDMLPNVSDTPEVALEKLAQVERMVAQKESADIQAFGGAGHDVSKFAARTPVDIGITKAGKTGGGGGLIPEARAGGQQLTTKDVEAMQWAQQNPNDPRAAGIINKLRSKGL